MDYKISFSLKLKKNAQSRKEYNFNSLQNILYHTGGIKIKTRMFLLLLVILKIQNKNTRTRYNYNILKIFTNILVSPQIKCLVCFRLVQHIWVISAL